MPKSFASLLCFGCVCSPKQSGLTPANALCILQLAGIAVLAIGLWLRFDSQTKSIFEQETNHSSFYTGEREALAFNPGNSVLTWGLGTGREELAT